MGLVVGRGWVGLVGAWLHWHGGHTRGCGGDERSGGGGGTLELSVISNCRQDGVKFHNIHIQQ